MTPPPKSIWTVELERHENLITGQAIRHRAYIKCRRKIVYIPAERTVAKFLQAAAEIIEREETNCKNDSNDLSDRRAPKPTL